MLKSCSYCGRIHDSRFNCGKKPNRKINPKNITQQNEFRNTKKWQKKRKEIKERDNFLCQICLKENRFEYNNLSVHHIVPLIEDYNLRLDDDNLITLCDYHHKLAERGEISKKELYKIIKNKKYIPPNI